MLLVALVLNTFVAVADNDDDYVEPIVTEQAGEIDGDKVDGDKIDGDETDGDETDGDETDGDKIDGDKIDGDKTDGDETGGDELMTISSTGGMLRGSGAITVTQPYPNGTANELIFGTVVYDKQAGDSLRIISSDLNAEYLVLHEDTINEFNTNGISVTGTTLADGIVLSSDGNRVEISNLKFCFITGATPYYAQVSGDILFEIVDVSGTMVVDTATITDYPMFDSSKCLDIAGGITKVSSTPSVNVTKLINGTEDIEFSYELRYAISKADAVPEQFVFSMTFSNGDFGNISNVQAGYGQNVTIESVSIAGGDAITIDNTSKQLNELLSPITVDDYKITHYVVVSYTYAKIITFYGELDAPTKLLKDVTPLDFTAKINISAKINQSSIASNHKYSDTDTIAAALKVVKIEKPLTESKITTPTNAKTVATGEIPETKVRLNNTSGCIMDTANNTAKHVDSGASVLYIDNLADKVRKFYITGGSTVNDLFGVQGGMDLTDLYIIDEKGPPPYESWETFGYDPYIFNNDVTTITSGAFAYLDDDGAEKPYPIAIYAKYEAAPGGTALPKTGIETWNDKHSKDRYDGYYLVANDVTENKSYSASAMLSAIFDSAPANYKITGVIFDFTNAGAYATKLDGPNYVPKTMRQNAGGKDTAMSVTLGLSFTKDEANELRNKPEYYDSIEGDFIPDAFKNRFRISYRPVPPGGVGDGDGSLDAYRDMHVAGYSPRESAVDPTRLPTPAIFKYVRFWENKQEALYSTWTDNDTDNNREGSRRAYWSILLRTRPEVGYATEVPFQNTGDGGIKITDTLPNYLTSPSSADFLVTLFKNTIWQYPTYVADHNTHQSGDEPKIESTPGKNVIIDPKYYDVIVSGKEITITLHFKGITSEHIAAYKDYYTFGDDGKPVGLISTNTGKYVYMAVFFSTEIESDIVEDTYTNTAKVNYPKPNDTVGETTGTAKFRVAPDITTKVKAISVKKEASEDDSDYTDGITVNAGTKYFYKITVSALASDVKIKRITDDLPHIGDKYLNEEPRDSSFVPGFTIEKDAAGIVTNITMTVAGSEVEIGYNVAPPDVNWILTETATSFTIKPVSSLYTLEAGKSIVITFNVTVPNDAYDKKAVNNVIVETDKDEIEDDTTVVTDTKPDVTPTSVSLKAKKTASANTGNTVPTDWSFDIALYNANASGVLGNRIGTDVAATEDAPVVTFGNIPQYTDEGTHYYIIKETATGGSGWTIDAKQYLIEVDVTENASNALVATIKYKTSTDGTTWSDNWSTYSDTSGSESVVFANTYVPAAASVALKATKSVGGADAPGTWSFDIGLFDANDSGTIGPQKGSNKQAKDDASVVTFDNIPPYTAVGTHYYIIKETAAAQAGWTFDTTEYLIKVDVTDAGVGQLAAAISYKVKGTEGWPNFWTTYSENSVTFNNTYSSDPTVLELFATKRVSGIGAPNTWAFDIELYEADDAGEVSGAAKDTKTAGSNPDDSRVEFDAINYTSVGTYYYLIKEKNASGNGWGTDTTEYLIKVVVENITGQLTVTETTYQTRAKAGEAWSGVGELWNANSVTFNNVYTLTPTNTLLKATKSVSGSEIPSTWSFGFSLYMSDVNGAQGNKISAMAATNAAKTVTFDTIDYTVAGEHYYLITEDAVSQTNWTIDTKQYLVHVVVANNNGKLEVTSIEYKLVSTTADVWERYTDSAIVFNNNYSKPIIPPPTTPEEPPTTPEEPPITPEEPPTTPEEPPTVPPTDPGTPPVTPQYPPVDIGTVLVPTDEGEFIEFDDEGTPLGTWRYDEEEETWIFEPMTPLGAVETGDSGSVLLASVVFILALFGVVYTTMGYFIENRNKKRAKR